MMQAFTLKPVIKTQRSLITSQISIVYLRLDVKSSVSSQVADTYHNAVRLVKTRGFYIKKP